MPIFGLTQGLPQCAHASFRQDGFQHDGFWKVGSTYYGLAHPLPPLTLEDLLCTCVGWKVPLTTRLRKMWLPYFFTQTGLWSCRYLYLEVSTGDCSRSAWGPSVSFLMGTNSSYTNDSTWVAHDAVRHDLRKEFLYKGKCLSKKHKPYLLAYRENVFVF